MCDEKRKVMCSSSQIKCTNRTLHITIAMSVSTKQRGVDHKPGRNLWNLPWERIGASLFWGRTRQSTSKRIDSLIIVTSLTTTVGERLAIGQTTPCSSAMKKRHVQWLWSVSGMAVLANVLAWRAPLEGTSRYFWLVENSKYCNRFSLWACSSSCVFAKKEPALYKKQNLFNQACVAREAIVEPLRVLFVTICPLFSCYRYSLSVPM